MDSPASSDIRQTSTSTHTFDLPSPYVFSGKIHQQYDWISTPSENFLHHELSFYENRLSTFISWPHQTPPHVLAAAGFFRYGHLTPHGRDTIECAFCGVRSINNSKLLNPWTIHQEQCSMLTTFKCRRCPEKFTSNSKLHHHIRIHHSKRASDRSFMKKPAISSSKTPSINPSKTPPITSSNKPPASPSNQPDIRLKTSTFQKASAPPSSQITKHAEPSISPLQKRSHMTMTELFRKFAARVSPPKKPAIKTWQWSQETELRLRSWTGLKVAEWLNNTGNLLESKRARAALHHQVMGTSGRRGRRLFFGWWHLLQAHHGSST